MIGARKSTLGAVFIMLAAAPGILRAEGPGLVVEIRVGLSAGKIVKVEKDWRSGAAALPRSGEESGEPPAVLAKDSVIRLEIVEDHQGSVPGGYDIRDHYEIEFTHAPLASEKPVLKADIFVPGRDAFRAGADASLPALSRRLSLSQAGRRYTLRIVRYDSLEDRLRGKNGAVVHEAQFRTLRRFFVGLSAGWLFPLDTRFDSFSLYHADPSDGGDGSAQTIRRTRSYRTKGIVFASLYPGGVEPQGPLSWRNLRLNLGTEISASILSSVYVGAGYDFGILALDVFYGTTRVQRLPAEYEPFIDGTIANKKITSLPLIEGTEAFLGVAVSLPFNAAAILGRLIGL